MVIYVKKNKKGKWYCMPKILILIEHVRVEHTIQHKDGSVTLDYMKSGMGKLLRKKLTEAGINMRDVDLEYVYPQIPEAKTYDFKTNKPLSYKDVTLKQVKERFTYLDELIVNNQYDMVIPTGKMGCKYLLNLTSITKLRGVPEWKSVTHNGQTHEFWTYPMYSMEYISFKMNEEILYDADLKTLKDFYEKGHEVFKPKETEYEFTTDINRIREYFNFLKTEKPISSWDLETNTFHGYREGAKVLVISISHEETQGITIPVEHKDHVWKDEELQEILELIKEYVADANQEKVLQNGTFDIQFLMDCYGFETFRYNMDTKIGYYLTVSQEASKSFKLSDLAYEYTDMGGYDKPLEDWKKEYIKNYKKENKNKAPVNEIDGGNFNYEWFPLHGVLAPYASGDVDCSRRIHMKLKETIDQDTQWKELYYNYYPRLQVALARMQSNGYKLDLDYLDMLDEAYQGELNRLAEAMRENEFVKQLEAENRALYEQGLKEWQKPKAERDLELAKLRDRYKNKVEFNPGSSKEKQRLLYEVMGVRPPVEKDFLTNSAKNKSEHEIEWDDYSTDKNTLNWINENVPEAEGVTTLLLDYNKAKTLHSTFVNSPKSKVHETTGLLHGNFNITGTDTSRLSSSNP